MAIVDGAAFGPEIGKIMGYLSVNETECVIYAPEYFEYIVLSSGLVNVPSPAIDETYNYADSMKYMSWEEYYTDYLIKATDGTIYKYSKSRLNSNYCQSKILERLKSIIPEQIQL